MIAPIVSPIMAPTMTSLIECLFNITRDHPINMQRNIKLKPNTGLIGIAKNARYRVSDTCNELLIKKFTSWEIATSKVAKRTPTQVFSGWCVR